jgi:hypothetical protein
MRRSALVAAVALVALLAAARASSHADNFQTKTTDVVCGIVASVPGTELDPGTGAPLDGTCSLSTSSARCTNGTGHGFKISTGHLSLF